MWKWLGFVLEILLLLYFTSEAYLVPGRFDRESALLLTVIGISAMACTLLSIWGFRRADHLPLTKNPPFVIFMLAAVLHIIVLILQFLSRLWPTH